MRWLVGKSEWGDPCGVPGCSGWINHHSNMTGDDRCVHSYQHPRLKEEKKVNVITEPLDSDEGDEDELICEGWVLYVKYDSKSDQWYPFSDDGNYMHIFRNINEADETLSELLEVKGKDDKFLYLRQQFILQAVYSDPDSGNIVIPVNLTDVKKEAK
jgi:hypothetical protein